MCDKGALRRISIVLRKHELTIQREFNYIRTCSFVDTKYHTYWMANPFGDSSCYLKLNGTVRLGCLLSNPGYATNIGAYSICQMTQSHESGHGFQVSEPTQIQRSEFYLRDGVRTIPSSNPSTMRGVKGWQLVK